MHNEKRPDAKVQLQVQEVLERFNTLVSTKNPKVLEEFAPCEDVMLIGSDAGEVAAGRQEIEDFFTRVFSGGNSYSWEWGRIDVSQSGDMAWFFTEGCARPGLKLLALPEGRSTMRMQSMQPSRLKTRRSGSALSLLRIM